MQFGVCLPHRWKYASARLIADVAQEAESLRFDSVWVTDHVIVPVHHVERGHIFYEALMTLAFVSSITRTVAMGTTVLATPTRNPVVLAREVATLDALSGGRVILGVGTGWIREELEAVGVAWTERGRFLDEGIKVLRHLWSQEGPISGTPPFERCCSNRSPPGRVGRRSGLAGSPILLSSGLPERQTGGRPGLFRRRSWEKERRRSAQ